jgi:hypothetical protein
MRTALRGTAPHSDARLRTPEASQDAPHFGTSPGHRSQLHSLGQQSKASTEAPSRARARASSQLPRQTLGEGLGARESTQNQRQVQLLILRSISSNFQQKRLRNSASGIQQRRQLAQSMQSRSHCTRTSESKSGKSNQGNAHHVH